MAACLCSRRHTLFRDPISNQVYEFNHSDITALKRTQSKHSVQIFAVLIGLQQDAGQARGELAAMLRILKMKGEFHDNES